jgi:hypothetical protein
MKGAVLAMKAGKPQIWRKMSKMQTNLIPENDCNANISRQNQRVMHFSHQFPAFSPSGSSCFMMVH